MPNGEQFNVPVGNYVQEGAKKFLVVCDGGNVRSHALAYKLKWEHRQEAIAVGRLNVKQPTMDMLCGWADYIVLMQGHMIESIPTEFHNKTMVLDVGPDKWGVVIHPDLHGMVTAGAAFILREVKERETNDPV